MANEEVKRIQLKQLVTIHARVLRHEWLHALQDLGAWAMYNYSAKANQNQAQKGKLLAARGVRLREKKKKRAMVTRFVRWQVAQATMSAAVTEPEHALAGHTRRSKRQHGTKLGEEQIR